MYEISGYLAENGDSILLISENKSDTVVGIHILSLIYDLFVGKDNPKNPKDASKVEKATVVANSLVSNKVSCIMFRDSEDIEVTLAAMFRESEN